MDDVIVEAICKEVGVDRITSVTGIGGGCINNAFRYDTDEGAFFVKKHRSLDVSVFRAEALGLRALCDTKTLRVPHPVCYGKLPGGGSFFIMEYLEMCSGGSFSQEEFGHKLALMHSVIEEGRFGFDIDNVIGSTPQYNSWSNDWVSFFSERRLKAQLDFVAENYQDEEILRYGERLLLRLPQFFSGIEVKPSLIHGDLWSGNVCADVNGVPIIFDPASYYAHHEAEWGIMTMFGGFSGVCQRAYEEIFPRKPGFSERLSLYQLYHYLNHYNIFGSSYRSTCISLLRSLL